MDCATPQRDARSYMDDRQLIKPRALRYENVKCCSADHGSVTDQGDLMADGGMTQLVNPA
jgi:hypothetical protein